MVEGSKIEEYIKEKDLYPENALHRLFFKMISEIKEKLKGEPLDDKELEKTSQDIQKVINEKLSISEEFNLFFAYKLSCWERENHQEIGRRERQDLARKMAYDLGLKDLLKNDIFSYALYELGVLPKEKIIPVDMRKESIITSPLKRKYNSIFKEFSRGDKKTIKGFKRGVYNVPPLSSKKIIKKAALVLLCTVMGLEFIDIANVDFKMRRIESQQVETILADYESRMSDYVQFMKDNDYTDLEAIMQIINDVHTYTQGMAVYGSMSTTPAVDTVFYARLAVGDSNGYGVCRSFADHLTYLLQEFNPNLKAHNMVCELGVKALDMADVERHKKEYSEEEKVMYSEMASQSMEGITASTEGEKTGIHKANHMITVISVPGKNYKLAIDAYNPAIYLFNDNQLIPLNPAEGTIYHTPLFEMILGVNYQINGIRDVLNMATANLSQEEIDKIREEWGLEAQNLAVEKNKQRIGAEEIAKKAFKVKEEKKLASNEKSEEDEIR